MFDFLITPNRMILFGEDFSWTSRLTEFQAKKAARILDGTIHVLGVYIQFTNNLETIWILTFIHSSRVCDCFLKTHKIEKIG
jgi:hypothetical protein